MFCLKGLLAYFSPFFWQYWAIGPMDLKKTVNECETQEKIELSLRSMGHMAQNRQKMAKNKRAAVLIILLISYLSTICIYFLKERKKSQALHWPKYFWLFH